MENRAPHPRRTDSDNDADQHREYMQRILRTLMHDSEDAVSHSSSLPPSVRPGTSLYSRSIQREILNEFPWLNEGLEQHRPGLSTQRQVSATSRALPDMQYGASNSTCTAPSGEESSLSFSKEDLEEYASLRLSVTNPKNPTPECFTEPPSDAPLLAWAQSMLDPQEFQSKSPYDPSLGDGIRLGTTPLISDQGCLIVAGGSNSGTPINSESLSSSISDGEAELKSKDEADGVGTSVESGKRKTPEREEGDDEKTDKFEAKKKQQPINRTRKKGGIKRVREPRYAIKTRTEVDIMDDGYKWRKYGQKAVKNSPHPRNYYRCTTAKCPVRKRVERCFEDPGIVVTTYEGTHMHQTPRLMNRTPPTGYLGPSGLFPPLGVGTPTLPSFSQNLSNQYQYRAPQWLLPHQRGSSLQENLDWRREVREDPVFRASIKSEPIQTFKSTPEMLATPQSQANLLSRNLNVSPQSQAFGQSGIDAPLSSDYQILGVDSYKLSQQYRESLRSRQLVDLQAAASSEIQGFGRHPVDYNSIGEPTFDRDTYARRQSFVQSQDQETRDQLPRVEIVEPTDEGVLEDLLRRPP